MTVDQAEVDALREALRDALRRVEELEEDVRELRRTIRRLTTIQRTPARSGWPVPPPTADWRPFA